MYLSRLLLNPRNNGARADLKSPYNLHRTLMRAFPDGEPDENRLLFRIEPSRPEDKGRRVLVQSSDAEPDLSFLKDSAGGAQPYCYDWGDPKEVDPTLEDGQQLAFRLLGNPTKKSQGKRIALTEEEQYYEWLDRKGNLHGFDVLYSHPTPYWINGDQPDQDTYAKEDIPHFAVRYDGLLTVTDASLLRETLAAGVGPAKSFGFGLLTLAPPR
jgi:CRISPR system Cascade subunit CasE